MEKKTNKNKNVRIVLTALVLLIGGYYIQKSATTKEMVVKSTESVHADAPIAPAK